MDALGELNYICSFVLPNQVRKQETLALSLTRSLKPHCSSYARGTVFVARQLLKNTHLTLNVT